MMRAKAYVKKKRKEKPESTFGKIWFFFWEDDSLLSWVANIIVAFILIKFIVYPVLTLLLGSVLPIVAVVSGSMEHKMTHPCIAQTGSNICIQTDKTIYDMCGRKFTDKLSVNADVFWEQCGLWYEELANISQDDFATYSFKNGFNVGDVMVIGGDEPSELELGDVVIFSNHVGLPIIHRIISLRYIDGQLHFTTKGDHNGDIIKRGTSTEVDIPYERYIGTARVRIPLIGYVKIIAAQFISIFI